MGEANQYINDKAPWVLAKEGINFAALDVLHHGHQLVSCVDDLSATRSACYRTKAAAFLNSDLVWKDNINPC